MTGSLGPTATQLPHGQDPLDDPLVAAWDAVVLGDRSVPADSDPKDTEVLRRFHAMESIPPPSDMFFTDLERQLAHLKASATAQPDAPASVRSVANRAAGTADAHADRGKHSLFAGRSRRFTSLAAAAALAVLLIAGPLVYYLSHVTTSEPPAIPAAVVSPPVMETLVQLDFEPPLWDMPSATAWEQMEFSMFLVDPGASFSTDIPWYTSVDGPMLIVPLSGDLIVQPVGPALVYRHGANAPVESPAQEPVILRPNDAIVFSSATTATGSNPGSEPVRAIYGLAGVFDDAMAGSLVDAHDVTRVDINYEAHLLLPSDGAALSIRHLQLAPLDTFVYELEPGWKLIPIYTPIQINDLRVHEGSASGLSPDILADAGYASLDQLKYPGPGPQTLINIGEETVDLYFLIIEPYPDTATPST